MELKLIFNHKYFPIITDNQVILKSPTTFELLPGRNEVTLGLFHNLTLGVHFTVSLTIPQAVLASTTSLNGYVVIYSRTKIRVEAGDHICVLNLPNNIHPRVFSPSNKFNPDRALKIV